ncbi:hypothetical protein [Solicola gregarius]|uniref:ARB-07466-like C-terminal domain-containing protein n=1 Tax=Solicola gregarius TaxID=2908642 RepID=A0AA46TIW7_9ACTN|nr:hypothetical protein [Solicola gregarius]UYM06189.1 hypothetical protein L0C25_03690 [Solicola gregarius]
MTTAADTPPRRRRLYLLPLTIVLVLVVGAGIVAWRSGINPLARTGVCSVEFEDGTDVEIDTEQAENASLMAAIAQQRGLPARAVSIAIATAFQESKIHNVEHGDRDSVGLFQQRPSQGWGTVRQILRPPYAIGAFYDQLEEVDGYESMDLHDAAQAVQRSADGGAYEQHELPARALASALTGNSPATFSCTIDSPDDSGQSERRNGLTENANLMLRDVRSAFGELSVGGFESGGIDSGHSSDSAHYEGRAVDFFFTPVNANANLAGWSLAHYAVANAERLDVKTVIYDDKIWTASRSSSGWRDYDAPDGPNQQTLRHLDHVHVDVA